MTAHIAYRREPRTIRIGKIEIPEPVREPLNGEKYFMPAIYCGEARTHRFPWKDGYADKRLLKQGMVYLTEEAAQEHAKALIALTAK